MLLFFSSTVGGVRANRGQCREMMPMNLQTVSRVKGRADPAVARIALCATLPAAGVPSFDGGTWPECCDYGLYPQDQALGGVGSRTRTP